MKINKTVALMGLIALSGVTRGSYVKEMTKKEAYAYFNLAETVSMETIESIVRLTWNAQIFNQKRVRDRINQAYELITGKKLECLDGVSIENEMTQGEARALLNLTNLAATNEEIKDAAMQRWCVKINMPREYWMGMDAAYKTLTGHTLGYSYEGRSGYSSEEKMTRKEALEYLSASYCENCQEEVEIRAHVVLSEEKYKIEKRLNKIVSAYETLTGKSPAQPHNEAWLSNV